MEETSLGNCFLRSYEPKCMNFLKWLNHFEYLVDFLHIPDDKKVEFLLNLMNPTALSHIQQKLEPAIPLYLPYDVLISHFEELYGFYQGEWAANYRYVFRDQFKGETVLQYMRALSRIVSKASIFLKNNVSLMVRLMNGLNDPEIKTLLRNCPNLTLDSATIIASEFELQKYFAKPN